jgi:phosphopantothenoylcysteine decarboxylase/phosphopantothenate--cysteine ligase
MRSAVASEFGRSDILVMAAAVSDWRVRKPLKRKIKRSALNRSLELVENPDILYEFGSRKGKKILVGFALETENLAKNALKKLKAKNLDLIIGNKITKISNVFGKNKLEIILIDKYGNKITVSKRSKRELAKIILDKAASLIYS